MTDLIRVTIDGKTTTAASDETIVAVARRLGIHIPTLCYMEDGSPNESCGVCMVEVEGRDGHLPACATRVADGMVVRTNTDAIRNTRKIALELLLSDHLGDCLAPCELGCPAHIDIPRFIRFLRKGKHRDAIATIKESVAFPGVLGRICPKICENACRRKELDKPVSIFSLKRFAADRDAEADTAYLPEKAAPSGKSVAVIGGGIAGLTAAYYLLRTGHRCTVLDAQSTLGGALRLIPGFRLPAAVLESEIETLNHLNLSFRGATVFGKDVTLDALRAEFDAVLLALGRTSEEALQVPGAEAVIQSCDWLRRAADEPADNTGKTALVLGSGPAVLDVARSLVRLGTESVKVLPDRELDKRALFRGQVDDAREEGVEILPPAEAKRIEALPTGGQVVADRDGEEVIIKTDRVFHAGDMAADLSVFADTELPVGDRGIEVDHASLQTNLDGVFAAGGVTAGGPYAVNASAAGRHAAESIDRYLRGAPLHGPQPVHVTMHHLSEEDLQNVLSGFERAPRRETQRVDADGFSEVDRGFTDDDAVGEAARCLQCACAKKDNCALRICATEYEADPHKYVGERPPFERELTHEEVVYEPAKCIRCGKCIRIAANAKEALGLTYVGRGFRVKVGVPFGETLKAGLRKVALECVAACPTGALAQREKDE